MSAQSAKWERDIDSAYLEAEEKLLEAEIAGEEQDPTPEEARLLETMRKGFMGEIEKLKKEKLEQAEESLATAKKITALGKACLEENIKREQAMAEEIAELKEKEGRWEVGQAIAENVIANLKEKLEQAEESLENAGYKWIESEGHYSCE